MSGARSNETDRLIQENQGLVFHLAGRIHRSLPVRHEYDDLVGYGMLGLVEAAKAYCPSKKTKFSTFAFFRIRGAIYDGISEACWMTRAQYRRHSALLKAEEERMEFGSGTSTSDTDDQANVTAWDYAQTGMVALTAEHADHLEGTEESASLVAVKLETKTLLCKAIEKLPRRENRLITMIYFEGYSLQDAAERIGISKSWASRLHQNVIERLAVALNRMQDETKTIFFANVDEIEKGQLNNG